MSDDGDIEQFFAHDSKHDNEKTQVVTKAKKHRKKRKADDSSGDSAEQQQQQQQQAEKEAETLRKRARFYVKSPEQWRVVSKYAPKRLEEFVQEKDFENKKEFQNSVMDGFHHIMATVIDKVSQADGHVREQILADVSLRKAIEEEGAEFVQYFSNKVKIAVLSFFDIANGKREQYANGPRRHCEESATIEQQQEEAEPISSDQGRGGGVEEEQEKTQEDEAIERVNLS